jgi:small subunit ribosomal protein S2
MPKAPAAAFIVDTVKEHLAVREAKRLGIPIVAMIDTNADPGEVDYPIPSNDDAIRAIKLFTHAVAEAYITGAQLHKETFMREHGSQASQAPVDVIVRKGAGDEDEAAGAAIDAADQTETPAGAGE